MTISFDSGQKISDWQPESPEFCYPREVKSEGNNFYALFIGIERYEPNLYYKNLQGCVWDIDRIANYLQNTLNFPQNFILKLISPLTHTNTLMPVSYAARKIQPTYRNIVQAFRQITSTAQSGDRIYVHYSGHKGRAVTIYPELEREQRYDEVIVPMDIGSSDGCYLRDVEIATLIKRLTDKGCVVTGVFDSSHWEEAIRGDSALLGDANNLVDQTPRRQDSLVASREMLLANWRILSQVDSELSAGWLPNANNCVLIKRSRLRKDHLIIDSRNSITQKKRLFTLSRTQVLVWLKMKILLMLNDNSAFIPPFSLSY